MQPISGPQETYIGKHISGKTLTGRTETCQEQVCDLKYNFSSCKMHFDLTRADLRKSACRRANVIKI